jgi:predicted amino acid dehydrogenase
VVLGGFSSIVSLNGLALTPPPGVKLSTGNCTTVASSCRILLKCCERNGIEKNCLAIVGATGNIGNPVSFIMMEKRLFSKIILISRSVDRLAEMRDSHLALIKAANPSLPFDTEIILSVDMNLCSQADVIMSVAATNTPIIFPKHINPNKRVLISDISLPNALTNDTRNLPNVVMVPFSGLLKVPGEADFSVSSHTNNGEAFACCSETMILGLMGPEKIRSLRLVGDIDLKAVEVLDQAAEQFGFYEEFCDKTLTSTSFKRS